MKLFKTLLTVLITIFSINAAQAYQTVTMDFPGNWYKINYISNENDAIVQFIRQGYNANNWEESVIFHTFKWSQKRNMAAKSLMLYLLKDVEKRNSTIKVEYLRLDPEESMSSWCVQANKTMPAHCELLRTTQSFEGALSMHYINKNPQNYNAVKNDWIERMNKAKVYQSYFRLDRILNKSMTFEL